MNIERSITPKSAGDGPPDPGRGLVVVVDDSPMQRRILTAMLGRMGHAVIEAETATKALELCESGNVAIVVSDWMMPEMDGLEFCRKLRASRLEAYVYFILLTSKSGKDDIAQGLDAGADDFLTKPVDGGELRARIVAGQRILAMQQELRQTLEELRTLYDSVDRDLIEARRLQRSLVREPASDPDGAIVRMFLRSSGRVGGDLVGSYPISDDRIGLYSIDVSGHGVASALLSARIAGHLSNAPEQNVAMERVGGQYVPVRPDLVAARLNDLILSEIETEHYFTICICDIDLVTGATVFCQAGHPHPVVQRCDGASEYLGQGGMPVGLFGEAEFEPTSTVLRPGDRLIIYTDGVTECADTAGQLLDEDGFARLLAALRDKRGRGFVDALLAKLEDFAGGPDFADDVSGVVFEFEGRNQS